MDCWFSPGEIRYTREQVLFILENTEILKEGLWPPEPKETGYTDEGKHPVACHAPYEVACMIIGEVEARLKSCGEAGEALADEAKYIELIDCLSRPARRALNYVSGFRRRRQSYSRWCWEQERKTDKKSVVINIPSKPCERHA